jgi:hypothetical protein
MVKMVITYTGIKSGNWVNLTREESIESLTDSTVVSVLANGEMAATVWSMDQKTWHINLYYGKNFCKAQKANSPDVALALAEAHTQKTA